MIRVKSISGISGINMTYDEKSAVIRLTGKSCEAKVYRASPIIVARKTKRGVANIKRKFN